MNPKLSVVMPAYNQRIDFIKKAADSILSQSFADFELIVIDSASTNNSSKFFDSIKDGRVKYHLTQHNRGEYWATNYAVGLSTGDYLTWVHSDDVLPHDSFKIRVETLENNQELDFVHGDIVNIDEEDREINKLVSSDENGIEVFNKYISSLTGGEMIYLVHHTTIMMKRDFFYKVGPFDEDLKFAGDIDWLVRALRIGKFKRIPQVLYFYRKHSHTRRVLDPRHGVDKKSIHINIAGRYADS